MANDNEKRDPVDKNVGGSRSDQSSQRKRVIGEGMTSPDSTQVPLKAETGEPDWDAIKGKIPPENQDEDDDRQSRR